MAEMDKSPQNRRLADILREELDRLTDRLDAGLPGQLRWPIFSRRGTPVQPADVSKYLQEAMLAQENLLEDVKYHKVVPNDYVVELNPDNYEQRYQPIEKMVCEQWRKKLLDTLTTANSRQGRKEYRFGGRIQIRIQPVSQLGEDEVRVRCWINPSVEAAVPKKILACLELMPGDRQWLLREEMTLMGRDEPCDICLDLPVVQQKRLVSGQHAYIRHSDGRFRIYDGSPGGKASLNGTYVNGRRVATAGYELFDGDIIILAALDPDQPRSDTPGVVTLRFRVNCS
jgi:hypothetical protein